MTTSDHHALQNAIIRAAACICYVTTNEVSATLTRECLAQALDAVETIDALTDPARDAFVPEEFTFAAPPVMRPHRLTLAQSLSFSHQWAKPLPLAA